jgi:hypothetical protein
MLLIVGKALLASVLSDNARTQVVSMPRHNNGRAKMIMIFLLHDRFVQITSRLSLYSLGHISFYLFAVVMQNSTIEYRSISGIDFKPKGWT